MGYLDVLMYVPIVYVFLPEINVFVFVFIQWLTKLQDATYAENIRRKIKDDGVSPPQFYQIDQDDQPTRQDTGGTAHMSLLAADGAAVSVTNTVGSLYVFIICPTYHIVLIKNHGSQHICAIHCISY